MSCVCVFIDGYPGSGKTTLTVKLESIIRQVSDVQIYKQDVNSSINLRKVHPIFLIWCLLRYFWIFGCCAIIIYSIRNPQRRQSILDSLKGSLKLVCYHHWIRSIIKHHSQSRVIMLLDEPDWHKLWSILFPAYRITYPKLLRHLVYMLRPPSDRAIKRVYIDLSIPIEVCISRFAGRESAVSRFNCSSVKNDDLMNLMRQDQLYKYIHEAVYSIISFKKRDLFINYTNTMSIEDLAAQILDLL